MRGERCAALRLRMNSVQPSTRPWTRHLAAMALGCRRAIGIGRNSLRACVLAAGGTREAGGQLAGLAGRLLPARGLGLAARVRLLAVSGPVLNVRRLTFMIPSLPSMVTTWGDGPSWNVCPFRLCDSSTVRRSSAACRTDGGGHVRRSSRASSGNAEEWSCTVPLEAPALAPRGTELGAGPATAPHTMTSAACDSYPGAWKDRASERASKQRGLQRVHLVLLQLVLCSILVQQLVPIRPWSMCSCRIRQSPRRRARGR